MRVERKGRKPRSVLFFVVACIGLWAIPVAIAGGTWAVGAGLESEAVSAPRIDYVTVGERMDAEVREAVVDVYYGSAFVASGGAGGTITTVDVMPGDPLTEGDHIASINGGTLIAYSQPLPLYRALSRGDRGPDVAALATFLSAMGLLDPGYVDDNFGPQLDRAVREFQRTLGYPVDGVFRPEFVLYVGPDFTVGTVSIQLGDQVAPGAEIVRGAPPVLRAEIVGVDLRPLPPFSGGPLSLEIAGTTFTVDGTSLEGEAVAGIAQGLAALSMSGELIDGGQIRRYSDAKISLENPSRWGALPSSAVYVGAEGQFCAVSDDETVESLTIVRDATGEIGTVLVPSELVGLNVLADVSRAAEKTLAQCK